MTEKEKDNLLVKIQDVKDLLWQLINKRDFEIIKLFKNGDVSQSEIARIFKTSRQRIFQITTEL